VKPGKKIQRNAWGGGKTLDLLKKATGTGNSSAEAQVDNALPGRILNGVGQTGIGGAPELHKKSGDTAQPARGDIDMARYRSSGQGFRSNRPAKKKNQP